MSDIIIIGGGPVGSYLASLLAECGIEVSVLEASSRLGHKHSCTGIVSKECVAKFHIEDSLILRKLNSARLFSPSGKELHVRRDETQACVLDRSAFDRWLARQAQNEGAEFITGCHATNITRAKDKVTVTASLSGETRAFSARAVVLACGFRTHFNDGLGTVSYTHLTLPTN